VTDPANTAASRRKLRLATTFLSVVLALLVVEAFYYFSVPPLEPDQKALLRWQDVPAPDFTITNLDGQAIHLADLKGRRVIVNFWATWCVPCLGELPDFVKLRAETSTNVVILGLAADDDETLRTFVKRNSINYPVAPLKYIPSPYQDIIRYPTTLVIDRNGVIQHIAFNVQSLQALETFANENDFTGTVKPAPQQP